MCGRYVLNLRPSQVRQYLEEEYDMPVADLPPDDSSDSPRQSYNFAPGYRGIVYRATAGGQSLGPGSAQNAEDEVHDTGDIPHDLTEEVKYKLQSMKWGLIPSWTKRGPDYASVMKTINCRDDSLSTPGGMWSSMKKRKRCIVLAQGFYEWLKVGPKEKVPHYVTRKDKRLMCFAGLWDRVQYEGSTDEIYSYTIITTDSNSQLKFLHDRMPVIFEPGSDPMKAWLDPSQNEWSHKLQSLLRPSSTSLEIYPVSKDVGKVGNNSAALIIPVNSKENKSNIANYFSKKKEDPEPETLSGKHTVSESNCEIGESVARGEAEEDHSPHPGKRGLEQTDHDPRPVKKQLTKLKVRSISATKNEQRRAPAAAGTQKITDFFGDNT